MKPVQEDKAGRGRREWIRRKVGSRRHHGDVKARWVEGNGWVRFIRRTKRGTKIQTLVVTRPAEHIFILAVFVFCVCGHETRRSGARAAGYRSVRGCNTPPRRSRRRRRGWGRRVSRGWSRGCRRAIHQLEIKVL